MKITYNPKSILLLGFLLAFVLSASFSAKAQISNSGDLYISNNSSIYLKANFKFGTSGTTSSARNSVIGKLSFAPNASSSGASGIHFMDGYIRKYGTESFIFPIGQTTTYAPIRVTPLTAETNGVDAAYYSSAPTIATFDAASVSKISTTEYWDIKGTALSNISLTWRASSAISTLTNATIANLIIVGYKTSTSKWVQIPSVVDATSILGTTSDLTSGSISSIGNVVLTDYTAFSLGEKGGCAVIVTSSEITKTWTLLGWVGADSLPTTPPSLADKAIIDSAFIGNLSCYSVVLNADITLADGQLVEIVDGATGTGKIIMSSQASVVQRSNTQETPKIVLTKTSREMKMFDYIYWGTPISENFITQIAGAKAIGSALSAFDLKFRYQTGLGGGWKPLATTEVGRGFITRIKQQAPFINEAGRGLINFTFTGTANNGDITVPNMRNEGNIYDYELLANPYPGSIDLAKFTEANLNLGGSIYLWTAGTAVVSNYTGVYNLSDYRIWNKSGETDANSIAQLVNGKIASGQSFRVQVVTDNTNATFNNCMRLTTGNTNFFRTTNAPLVMNRFKLNMTGSNGVFSQTLIAYLSGATYGFDRDYDAVSNSVSTAKIYSLLGTTQLAINGRHLYDAADVVSLGVSKTTTNTENFTISLVQQEGIFANGTATVYLHDILLGTYHDFIVGNYTFTTNTLASNDRFEVVYTNPNVALNNADYSAGQVIATINTNTLTIVTSNEMESVDIFDLTGRKVLSIQNVSTVTLTKPFNYSEGIYIAKIKFRNGATATQKLINKK